MVGVAQQHNHPERRWCAGQVANVAQTNRPLPHIQTLYLRSIYVYIALLHIYFQEGQPPEARPLNNQPIFNCATIMGDESLS